jgi:hypothetical protein
MWFSRYICESIVFIFRAEELLFSPEDGSSRLI